MLALDASAETSTESDDPVDKYLPEPQSFQAVLKLDDDIRSAWLHAIKMEIKNLIDHGTFILGQKPHVDELIIPVKLVLKAKQTASGKLDKLKARLVARGDMEKRRIKKTKAKYQQQLLKQREENTKKVKKTNTIPIRSLNLLKTHGHPVHLQEGSSSSYPKPVLSAASLKVLTSLEPTSKPKLLDVTL
jgi:hypothetical protein